MVIFTDLAISDLVNISTFNQLRDSCKHMFPWNRFVCASSFADGRHTAHKLLSHKVGKPKTPTVKDYQGHTKVEVALMLASKWKASSKHVSNQIVLRLALTIMKGTVLRTTREEI